MPTKINYNPTYSISINGINLIKKHEGFRNQAYQDSGGVWTIGYGSTFYQNGIPVKKGDIITDENATLLLYITLISTENNLNQSIVENNFIINQNQFDALMDFIYNVGFGNFETSTLFKDLKLHANLAASDEFMRWIYDDGVVVPGLVVRREDEKDLFLS